MDPIAPIAPTPSPLPPSTPPLSRYQKRNGEAARPASGAGELGSSSSRPEEGQLRSQRLESLGALAGGIAHDLNNVLAPISMCLATLREECPSHLDEVLDTLSSSVDRGSKLVRQVLTFARGMDGRAQELDPNEILGELENLLRQTLPGEMEIDVGRLSEPWAVVADPTGLHQVLLNLCVNARDATNGVGRLAVSVATATVTETRGLAVGSLEPGDYVVFCVEDDGVGIPADAQERIFEPFFTTKEVGSGTGLGLSTSASIVTSLGGGIALQSRRGEGATFRIYVPARPALASLLRAESPPTVVEEAIEPPEGPARVERSATTEVRAEAEPGRATVLVVDDEARIRKMLGRILESFGHRVVEVEGGREALEAYEARGTEIGLVITDLAMPGLDGYELVERLKSQRPDLPIVVTSGLADSARIDELREMGVARFLAKPFFRSDLADVLEEVARAPQLRER